MEGDELDTFSYSSLGLLLVAMDTSQRRDGVSRGASPGLLRDLSHDVMVTGCSQVKLQRAGAPPRRPAAAAALPQGRGGLPRPAAAGHDAVTLWETFGPSAARPCSSSHVAAVQTRTAGNVLICEFQREIKSFWDVKTVKTSLSMDKYLD